MQARRRQPSSQLFRARMERRVALLQRHIGSCAAAGQPSPTLPGPLLLDFSGKLVLVTGAGHGIGRHIAVVFQRCGARVWGCDLSFDDWGAPLDGAGLPGPPLSDERVVDVTEPAAVRGWVAAAEKAHNGAAFVLVNCAGGVGGLPSKGEPGWESVEVSKVAKEVGRNAGSRYILLFGDSFTGFWTGGEPSEIQEAIRDQC